MASHRRPKQPSRARVTVLTAAAATAVALSAQVGAQAAPAQPSTDEVKTQVDGLLQQQEAASEKYDGAKERADQLRQQAAQLQDQVARGQDQLVQLESGLSAVAAEQYQTGGVDPSIQLMLSANPANYLQQASSADQANATEAAALKALKEQQRQLDQEKQEAATVLAELDSDTQALNDAKSQVQGKLNQAQQLLDTLTAAQRATLESDRASRDSSRYDLGSLPDPGGYAEAAVQAALGRQGKPYQWGATGPNAFDCSGLMVWSYGQAGVSLPRTSEEQESVGTAVPSLSEAQPGDLIIYDSGEHVGMYIGNNLVVHAPHTGAYVRVESATDMPIYMIRRV